MDFFMKLIPWKQYKLNLKNYLYIHELNSFLTTLIKYENPVQIYLFGSLASLDFTWDSDADLFILFNGQCEFQSVKQRLLTYTSLENMIIDPFPYNDQEFLQFASKPELFIYNALKKSVLIYTRVITNCPI